MAVRTTVICHFKDEELLLPYWLRRHRTLFDHGVMLDRGSTDRSVEVIRALAPGWEVVRSEDDTLDARGTDLEVMAVEREHEGWKIALTATELLVAVDLHARLEELERAHDGDPPVLGIPIALMADRREELDRPPDPGVDLPLERAHGRMHLANLNRTRFLHRRPDGAYSPGRHRTAHAWVREPSAVVCKYRWAPFTIARERRLRVGRDITAGDVRRGWGVLHLATLEELELLAEVEAEFTRDLAATEPLGPLLRALRDRPPAPRRLVATRAAPAAPPRRRVSVLGAPRGADALAAAHDVRGAFDPAWTEVVVADVAALLAEPAAVASVLPLALDLAGESPTEPGVDALLDRADLLLAGGDAAWEAAVRAAGRGLAGGDDEAALRAFVVRPSRAPAAVESAPRVLTVSADALRQHMRRLAEADDQLSGLLAEHERICDLHQAALDREDALKQELDHLRAEHRRICDLHQAALDREDALRRELAGERPPA